MQQCISLFLSAVIPLRVEQNSNSHNSNNRNTTVASTHNELKLKITLTLLGCSCQYESVAITVSFTGCHVSAYFAVPLGRHLPFVRWRSSLGCQFPALSRVLSWCACCCSCKLYTVLLLNDFSARRHEISLPFSHYRLNATLH